MYKGTCVIPALIFCLLFAGCSKQLIYVKSELKAWEYMADAAALEKSGDYAQAAQAYTLVAEQYSSSSYYTSAVRKAALLNIHPSNSKMDMDEALRWFAVYVNLSVSAREKEIVRSHIALLNKLKSTQVALAKANSEKNKISVEKDKLLTLVRKKSGEMEATTLQIKTLESDLSETQDQLKKMKKVDLQMHTRKVNGNDTQPVEPVQQTIALYPEAYSPAVSVAHAKESRSKDPGPAQTTARTQCPKHETVLRPCSRDTGPSKPDFYPYTIQICSFFQKEDSLRAARESRKQGESTFTCPAHVPGKGHWYRVFLGWHRTLKEAKETARQLKSQKHPHAFVSKMPYAIQIEPVSSEDDLSKVKSELQSQGYLAYDIPDKTRNNKSALLVGAFRTEEEAAQQAWYLRKNDLKPIVVRR